MKLYFIRHGKTAGNIEKRYEGKTDEPLCEKGRGEIEKIAYPEVKTVLTSPLRRCVETAGIIYPDKTPVIVAGFRECDFGAFEGKNHKDLDGTPIYQAWIDSGGEMRFPMGESKAEFCARTVEAFKQTLPLCSESAAFVVHGGTIMAILEHFAVPRRGFYDYYTENAHGYSVDFDGVVMRIDGRI